MVVPSQSADALNSQELINRIDFFTKNEDRYRKLGMPYTLGMMFHGVRRGHFQCPVFALIGSF